MKRMAILCTGILLLGAGCLRTTIGELRGVKKYQLPPVSEYAFQDSFLPEEEPTTSSDILPLLPEDPNVQPGEIASESQNVIVSSVIAHSELPNPFVLLGRARAFENVVYWRIRDARRLVLASGQAITNAPDAGRFGAFRIRAFIDTLPETDGGTVEVFTRSPRDGSEQDTVNIPVTLSREVTMLKAYFSNIEKDPGAERCEQVYPVTRRVYRTQNAAEAAALELLKGPTALERGTGSRTSLLPGTALRSIVLKEGVLTADFSRDIVFALAGSCNIQALRAQIEQTFLQFPTVQVVHILVEGENLDKLFNP
ncbi:GerMN domain-containing protein [Patescibacteria group bacterium]|uniref:GerMN domain-containing protein n=1 Tax=candidate division WWE3 bacterium TaxID=2053526 RepID=A0A928TX96_UNCKA|nr:GerMN domain-containing protein [candidate division WWE3 bacterium]MCL4732937.1 GerMN domain-containing protein [Patescibacteria group bacterium]